MKDTICTHCKTSITCNVEDIAKCDCSKVEVSNNTKNFLKSTYHKCLCNTCLEKINILVERSKQGDFPKRRSEMVEGIHYYMENEYFIFTEYYHLLKGQCCQNGCRHCVYGFKNRFI